MKAIRLLSAAALASGAALTLQPAMAQVAGLQRTDLLKRDLSVAGRETPDPGPHSHPRADRAGQYAQ